MSSLIEIQSQIAALQAQAAEIKAHEFTEKLATIKEIMSAYGITIQDLEGKPAKTIRQAGTKSANPAPAKYKGPNGELYSGRGIQPRWLSALVAAGHTKEEYLINK